MADRGKVLRALKQHLIVHDGGEECVGCPYSDFEMLECERQLYRDVEELLKAQEPILLENQHKPYGISTNANSPWISRCPRCGKKVEGKQARFCKYCGQAVKWE
jgi:hypothetical protein